MTNTQPTFSLYRGVTISWYRYATRGRAEMTYTTTWYLNGQWYHGPARRDVADAVQAAERTIDRQLRTERSR